MLTNMLTSLRIISIRKGKRFSVSKQGQPEPHVQSKATIVSPQMYLMLYCVIYIESWGDKICHVKVTKRECMSVK